MTVVRWKRSAEGGFTLVEMMASVLVFSIMTIGIVPLLASSIRGAGTSRASTVGKNIAVQTMERIRGLPYFVAHDTQGSKVDVLDLYFPDVVAPNYSAGIYTTTCDATTSSNPACPRNLPDDYAVTFEARFVKPVAGGGLETVPPAVDYAWNSIAQKDLPPIQLLEMTLTSSWTFGGDTKDYTLRSLIGDRKIVGDRIRGRASIDYAVQVVTNFVDPLGTETQLTATAATSESRIESRLLSSADQLVRAGRLRLVQLEGLTVGQDLEIDEGATSVLHTPEDKTPAGVTAGTQSIVHPTLLLPIAGLDDTSTSGLQVAVSNELPKATGTFNYLVGPGEESGDEPSGNADFWVHNQADTGTSAALRLDPFSKLLSLRATGSQTLTGNTFVLSTSVATPSTRKVEGFATVAFKRMKLFTALLPTAQDVIRISDFTATVTCTATPTGTPVASATWEADLQYFKDSNPSDNIASGSLIPPVELASSKTSDPLATLGPESEGKTNPLVYDGLTIADDVYLFEDGAKKGYLKSWNSVFGQNAAVTSGGEEAEASIESAIFIHTAPTKPTLPNSGLKVTVGKLGCDALDKR